MSLGRTLVALLLLVARCGAGNAGGRTLTRMESDSLSAALATIWGDYIKNKVAKEGAEVNAEYMRGVEEAMKLAENNDAYFRGLAEGITMNNRLEQVEELGGVSVDRSRFVHYLSRIAKGRPAGNYTAASADAFITFLMTKLTREAKIVDGSAAFLEEQAKREGVVKTPSGLLFEVITEGEGEKPGPNDKVLVNYQGAFIDGQVFNRSEEGRPMAFDVAKTIKGFSEGLQMMKKGGRYRLYIPSSLGYDAEGGIPGTIPVGAATIFDVELLDLRHVDAPHTEEQKK